MNLVPQLGFALLRLVPEGRGHLLDPAPVVG